MRLRKDFSHRRLTTQAGTLIVSRPPHLRHVKRTQENLPHKSPPKER